MTQKQRRKHIKRIVPVDFEFFILKFVIAMVLETMSQKLSLYDEN